MNRNKRVRPVSEGEMVLACTIVDASRELEDAKMTIRGVFPGLGIDPEPLISRLDALAELEGCIEYLRALPPYFRQYSGREFKQVERQAAIAARLKHGGEFDRREMAAKVVRTFVHEIPMDGESVISGAKERADMAIIRRLFPVICQRLADKLSSQTGCWVIIVDGKVQQVYVMRSSSHHRLGIMIQKPTGHVSAYSWWPGDEDEPFIFIVEVCLRGADSAARP